MKFEFLEPTSIAEALSMLSHYRERAKILAGGTDLIVQMKQGVLKPDVVIHVGRIEELKGIHPESAGGLRIGTLTTMRTLEKTSLLQGPLRALGEGATQVSCPQIRNVATLGGNSCNGIPSADTVPALIALNARALIAGPKGKRSVPMENFHRGPGQTVLETDELLLEFEIPPPHPFTGSSYFKYSPRGTSELAVVGVAASITVDPKDGVCRDARIALGACAPTPLRAMGAETILLGNRLNDGLIAQAADQASREARPNPGISVRASAWYRRAMVRVFTRHAIEMAWRRAPKP